MSIDYGDESFALFCRGCGRAFQPEGSGRWVHVCSQTAKITRANFGDAETEQQLQKTQEALESSLALQEEDQQTIATMRTLLEEAIIVADKPSGQYPWLDLFKLKVRAFLAEHPQPIVEELVDEKDDD